MSVWSFPFADRRQGRLTRRQWGWLIIAFVALHYLSLGFAVWSGSFDPDPNHDHVHVMRDVLAPVVFATQGSRGEPGRGRRWMRTVALVVVFFLAQTLVTAPWQLHQRQLGESGVLTAPVFFYAFVDGFARHPGNRVSDWVREHRDELPLTLDTVVELNTRWLREDPAALLRLYALKIVRTWYLSDSGRWDGAIAGLHLPWWLGAILGLGLWVRKPASSSRGIRRLSADPALAFLGLTVLYFWGVSALVSGLARYMAPVYGLLAAAAGVTWEERRPGRGR